ncbi:hypothetical protein ACQVP2_22570 [Methylobacterium aquaticum]|uniref:hypothetical protein n=1 Tax=Methylobacterium aquaticum TaxID=270351 RepID=UPI003D16D710
MAEQSQHTTALRQSLALTSAALSAAVASGRVTERDVLTLTGEWADLGSVTVREILDRAGAVLGCASVTPANIDSLPERS